MKQSDSISSFAELYRNSPLRNVCVPLQATVRETLEVIDSGAKEIALVLNSAGELVGTVTDGDVRRSMLRGQDLDVGIKDVMCETPLSLPFGASPMQALRMMVERSIHQVPMLDPQGHPIALRTLDELVSFEHREPRMAVIMAGGRGKRLMPMTDETPKPLLKVGKRPICETVVRQLAAQGISNITISLNYKADAIREHFQDGHRYGIEISYVQESDQLGTAGALGLLPETPKSPFLVTNADLLTKVNIANLFQFHDQEGYAATVCVRRYAFDVPYGVADIECSELLKITEKPRHEFFVNAGIYVLNPEVLNLVNENEYLDMPDLMTNMRKNGLKIGAFPLREFWLDVGNPADFERAEQEYNNHFED